MEVLSSYGDQIKVIELKENYGFTGGYNRGLREIESDIYILLNSDVRVNAGWLEPLVESMADARVGACQPKILSDTKPEEFEYAGACGGYIDYMGFTFCRGRIFDVVEKDNGQYDAVKDISWATGAAICIRADLYHQLGGLDESYFAHFEEIDLCWRMRRAGYRLVCNPQSVVYHLGGGTLSYQSANKVLLNYRNNLSTIIKNESGWKLLWLVPVRLALEAVSAYKFLFSGQVSFFWAVARAHFAVIGRIGSLLKSRNINTSAIDKIKLQEGVNANHTVHRRSIIFDYFLSGKKHFSDL